MNDDLCNIEYDDGYFSFLKNKQNIDISVNSGDSFYKCESFKEPEIKRDSNKHTTNKREKIKTLRNEILENTSDFLTCEHRINFYYEKLKVEEMIAVSYAILCIMSAVIFYENKTRFNLESGSISAKVNYIALTTCSTTNFLYGYYLKSFHLPPQVLPHLQNRKCP